MLVESWLSESATCFDELFDLFLGEHEAGGCSIALIRIHSIIYIRLRGRSHCNRVLSIWSIGTRIHKRRTLKRKIFNFISCPVFNWISLLRLIPNTFFLTLKRCPSKTNGCLFILRFLETLVPGLKVGSFLYLTQEVDVTQWDIIPLPWLIWVQRFLWLWLVLSMLRASGCCGEHLMLSIILNITLVSIRGDVWSGIRSIKEQWLRCVIWFEKERVVMSKVTHVGWVIIFKWVIQYLLSRCEFIVLREEDGLPTYKLEFIELSRCALVTELRSLRESCVNQITSLCIVGEEINLIPWSCSTSHLEMFVPAEGSVFWSKGRSLH